MNEKLYILTVRTLYSHLPDDVNTDDHWIFNDLQAATTIVEKLKTKILLKPVMLEEGTFKNNMLVGKRVIENYLSVTEEDEENEEE